MPPVLVVLAVIALVLWIIFNYFVPSVETTPKGRALLALLIIVLVLIFWFVLPLRVG